MVEQRYVPISFGVSSRGMWLLRHYCVECTHCFIPASSFGSFPVCRRIMYVRGAPCRFVDHHGGARSMVVRANVPIVGGPKVKRADAIMHEGGWSRCVRLCPMNTAPASSGIFTSVGFQGRATTMATRTRASKVNSVAASTANFNERLIQNSTRLLWLVYAVTSASWNMVAEHFRFGTLIS
jgi:hypothetical protein